jgi:hypothetical protein
MHLHVYFSRSACFIDVASATFTWDVVCTLLHLLGISNRSSFHQCPTECLFSFENGPDIEMVPHVSEFLRNTPKVWDNDRPDILCLKDDCFSMASSWRKLYFGSE